MIFGLFKSMTLQASIAIISLASGKNLLKNTKESLKLEESIFGNNLKWEVTYLLNSNCSRAFIVCIEDSRCFANLILKDH